MKLVRNSRLWREDLGNSPNTEESLALRSQEECAWHGVKVAIVISRDPEGRLNAQW
jgi:hypothetical protein